MIQTSALRQTRKSLRENFAAWGLMAPSLIFMSIFTVYPVFKTILLSFYRSTFTLEEDVFIGLQNYIDLFHKPLFWKVMGNTCVFSLLTVIPSMIVGLFLAKLINRDIKGIGLLRSAYFYPVVLPMIAWASIWMFIYMVNNGLLDQLSIRLGGKALHPLSNKNTVLPALAFMYVVKEAGYLMIFFLSGLQAISGELREAASLDGASAWQVFRKVELPLLGPTFLFVSTIALTNSVKLVDHIVIMTEGAPNNASTTLLYLIYQEGFTNFNYGVSSTLTVIMLFLLMLISLPRFIRKDKQTFYT